MAGILKPSDTMLIGSKKEMTDYILGQYNLNENSPEILFNQLKDNLNFLYTWNYFTITFNKNVNIYRLGSGTTSGTFRIRKLNINTNSFIDVTDSIVQNTNISTANQWELYIENLPKGTYRFEVYSQTSTGGGSMWEREWFLEEVILPSQVIKDNVKNIILNNKLFQEHCVTSEEE